MRTHAALIVIIAGLAALAGAVAVLFRWRLGAGDIYPPYSSLRADPLGTRALHDSLAELPGIHVTRYVSPLDTLLPTPARTILIIGVPIERWRHLTWEEFDALDAAARSGSRVVMTVRSRVSEDDERETSEDKPQKAAAPEHRDDDKTAKDPRRTDPKHAPVPRALAFADLGQRWGATLKQRALMLGENGAVRGEGADLAELPGRLRWGSENYFGLEPSAGWRTLYRRGSSPVVIERSLGRGTLVLAGDSYFVSNEALQRDRSTSLLAWLVGPHREMTFDESHLGIEVNPGIAALARRYGLAAAFVSAVLLAALYVWRETVSFVPAPRESPELALTYHPAAGLQQLFKRSLTPAELGAACVEEWRRTARDSERARVDAALATLPAPAPAVSTYNTAARALRKR